VAPFRSRCQPTSQLAPQGRSGFLRSGAWFVLAFSLFCGTSNAAVPATNEFIPNLPKLWLTAVEARASVGYKDNLTLGRAATEKSLLLGSGMDVTIARLPLDGKQFNFLLSADDTRYPQGDEVKHEDLVVALAQFKVDLSPQWRIGLDARYLFQDQVVDTSVTETNLTATLVRGNSLALMPNLRWTFARETWLELSGTAQRQYYRKPLDDDWEGGPKLMLGRDYGHRSTLTLAYAVNFRNYDTREQESLSGTNIPGTSLDFLQQDVDLAWRHNWDPRRRWRTTTRLGFQANQDNGPGFYDYRRYLVSQQLRYVAPTWEIKAQGRMSFYDFQFQRVSASDPELRQKAIVNASLRGEKKLGKHWSLFAEYEYEQSLSNRAEDEYRANRVAGGVGVEF
jgi:hypothetical protein